MHVSTTEVNVPDAMTIQVTDDALIAELSDGRTISVPLCWYPRLVHATLEERDNWELIGTGEGVHWPDLDEDLSIEGILGRQEVRRKPTLLQAVLEAKQAGLPVNISEIRPDTAEDV